MFGPGGKGFGGEGGDFANSTQKMGTCGILGDCGPQNLSGCEVWAGARLNPTQICWGDTGR